ncbi:excalibur calcium-binding domain-containing protein [Deinococcus sp. QL22]|uniref:excalibur calcium-binding domain-containing protein n=1 Tax=Deinococcus sp. QL22 TaxID=2939437 RepID=UPI002017DA62|nr:excalibur calcium-binding domain-containing protein [Deinococcus sp. QL22]UQN07293.1 excalibur calcium-binding domain-containing protein [Deinococcus sp. QL22]
MRTYVRMVALAAALMGMSEAATALTTATANLRRTPTTTGAVLGTVPKNTLVLVACSGSTQWCRTTYKGTAGYVARSLLKPVTGSARLTGNGTVYYRTCTQMRAAGVAPVKLGEPAYRTALDRNQNSIACERGE